MIHNVKGIEKISFTCDDCGSELYVAYVYGPEHYGKNVKDFHLEKCQKCMDEITIDHEKELEELQSEMDQAKDMAYDQGYERGSEEGHKEGYELGLEHGYENGYVEGHEYGFEKGQNESSIENINLAQINEVLKNRRS